MPLPNRKILAAAALSVITPASAMHKEEAKCEFKGISLKGNVQIVDSFPDMKVQLVDSFPDIRVKKVSSFPDKCGKWKFVTNFPDFKIQLVDSFPDIKVKYVESFPGVD